MNKSVVAAIVVVVVIVVAAGALLALPRGPPSPPVRTFQLEAKEFAFNGLGYTEFPCSKAPSGPCGPSIQVKAGETVKITLKNAGGADHEFMVVSDKKAPGHPDPDVMGAMTDVVKLGETKTITFVADKPGKYFYACFQDAGTKPERHVDRGMYGEFTVQP